MNDLQKFAAIPETFLNEVEVTLPDQSGNVEGLEDTLKHIGEGSPFNSTESSETPANGTESPKQAESSVSTGEFLSAAFVIDVTDMVAVFLLVNGTSAMGYDVNGELIKLSEAEKKKIEPYLEAYLKTINVKLTPLQALLFMAGGIYAPKFAAIIEGIKRKEKKVSISEMIKEVETTVEETLNDRLMVFQEEAVTFFSGKRRKSREKTIEWMKEQKYYPVTEKNLKLVELAMKNKK